MSEELQALLAELGLVPHTVVPLPRVETPANTARTYRLELPGGVTRKAVEASTLERAATVEQVFARLRLPALPRLFGRRGRALVFEWIEGEPVGDEMLECAGTLLGRMHALAPHDLRFEPAYEPEAAAARLTRQTHRLVAEGLVEPATAARLLALVPPAPTPACFTHSDLCPENLLVSDGALRIIDNGSWAVAPAGFDLGRAIWRWPLRGETRARFLAAYRDAGGAALEAEALAFWIGVAAVGGTAYRIGGPVAEAARRLQELV
jgi:aminoglycoside phosphotransferase (APT) family kinase protein